MAKAEWEKVPPVVRQEIMKREGDVAKLVADTKTDVAISSEMKRMFAPFAPVLQKYNVEPILAHGGAAERALYAHAWQRRRQGAGDAGDWRETRGLIWRSWSTPMRLQVPRRTQNL